MDMEIWSFKMLVANFFVYNSLISHDFKHKMTLMTALLVLRHFICPNIAVHLQISVNQSSHRHVFCCCCLAEVNANHKMHSVSL